MNSMLYINKVTMTAWLSRLLMPLLFCLLCQPTMAKDYFGYSDQRPLIVVSDWDFRPFEFTDNNGHPAGYNIEVLQMIFNRLEIPYRIVMKEWHDAAVTFASHDADLIHAMPVNYRSRSFFSTQKYVNYYTLCAARKVTTPKYHRLMDLTAETSVALKRDDYAANTIKAMDSIPFRLHYVTPKDALTGVRTGVYDYFIWGKQPLQRKAKELALDSLVFDEVDIPAGELHIIGYDKDIIDLIDDEYTRMEQAGEIQPIYNKWFRPELVHDEAKPITYAIIIILAIILFVVLVLGGIIYLRIRAAVSRNTELHNMMTQALGMGDFYVLEYDIKTKLIRNAYGTLLPPEGIEEQEFLSRFRDDEATDFIEHLTQMELGNVDEWTLRKHWNTGTADHPVWREFEGSAILEHEKGEPRYVFHAFKDITREVQEKTRNQELTIIYKKVFETNLIAMSFYDAEGRLLDTNQKMRQLLHITPETEAYFREGNLFDDDFTKGFVEKGSRNTIHMCGRVTYPAFGIDLYIESRVRPVFDDMGRHAFYVVSTRDVTAERDLYMKQREHDRQLKAANDQIARYEQQLRYLLEESKMYVFRYDVVTRIITFTQTLRQSEYTETIDEYIGGLSESSRDNARQGIAENIMKGKPFFAVREFDHTPISEGHVWHSFSAIPISNDEGNTHYFGIVRDITDLMSAQQRLREETARAEDSGRLKSAFLANMTHEIRTPLNAIVGFSDILQMVDSSDERMEMIRIIRNNCDMLLRLINDILEASSMGQSLLIVPEEIDLPRVFDDICMTLAQRVQEVPFIKDNPLETYPATLDKGRLQQILTNFTTNAVKYTHEGHVKVGWRPEERDGIDGLYFYCEDTGAGIPKDKQAAVFERFVKLNDFVQGTGLGLSICKAIIDKCAGFIGVDSEGEGHGSTFWFWIPRDLHIDEEETAEA